MNNDIFGEIIGYLPITKLHDMASLSKQYYDCCKQLFILYPHDKTIYPLDVTVNDWKQKYNDLVTASMKAVELAHILQLDKNNVYLIIDDSFTLKQPLHYYDHHDRAALDFFKQVVPLQHKFKVVLRYCRDLECHIMNYMHGNDTIHIYYTNNVYDLMYRYCYFYNNYTAVDQYNLPFEQSKLLNILDTNTNQLYANIISKRIELYSH